MPSFANAINNQIGGTLTGTTAQLLIYNDSNTASSESVLIQRVGGGTAGDVYLSQQVTGGLNYAAGIDNSDSDKWKLTTGSNPSTGTTTISADATGGQYRGYNTNTAPAAGFIGEQIRATVAQGSAGSQPTGTPRNVTSISLTAGIWDVSAVCVFQGMTTGTALQFSISTVSAALGTDGDNFLSFPFVSQASQNASFTIPSYRISLSATTTVYLVANSAYTVGTGSTYGRISATRVG